MIAGFIRTALEHIDWIFSWVRLFYPAMPSYKAHVLFLYFIPQKVLFKNFYANWPVHSSSRVLFADKMRVGKDSAPGMSQANYIQARNGIFIGENVRLGPGVGLISANHDTENLNNWTYDSPIKIGDNVWIGMNSVVLPGVTIGSNVVIGAGSVVTRSIPSNCVAYGNPCVVARNNNDTSTVN